RIETLEKEQHDLTVRLGDPGLYQDEPEVVPELKARIEAIEAELLQAFERWEALEGRGHCS
ncbi:MAG: hypothetical protein DRP71_08425, partial [Verrucomicrobia bacterium]